MQKKATIYDVAKLSGVSPATVSRVINQPTVVSDSTRAKVYASIKELGFPIRETFSDNRTNISGGFIIVNLPTLNNPFYNEIVQGVMTAASRYDCTVLLITEVVTVSSVSKIKSIIKKLKPIGFITLTLGEPHALTMLNNFIPVVQCCECHTNINIPSVTVDDVSAAFLVVDYLFSLGKRKIAMINGPLDTKYGRDRLEGYKKALAAHSLPYNPSLVTNLPDINYNIAVSAATQMLSSSNTVIPDAIFTASDVYAIAVIRAAHFCNLRIPEDLFVIGFDNIELSSLCIPSITTVNQPRTQLGFSACDLLFDRIFHPDLPIKHMTLDTEIILRESTAANNI